jgi:ferredoxin
MTHVTIDSERCQGHGRCALIAPAVFDVDDSGMGLVLSGTVAEADLPVVREADLSCPESAIRLTTTQGEGTP